jgi:hypothetical protein
MPLSAIARLQTISHASGCATVTLFTCIPWDNRCAMKCIAITIASAVFLG